MSRLYLKAKATRCAGVEREGNDRYLHVQTLVRN